MMMPWTSEFWRHKSSQHMDQPPCIYSDLSESSFTVEYTHKSSQIASCRSNIFEKQQSLGE